MASTQVETVSTNTDKVKLSLAVVLVLASLVGFYMLSKQGQVAQWGVLLAGLVAAVVVFASSELGRQFIAFGRDSVREVKKVVWPARREARRSSGGGQACPGTGCRLSDHDHR